MIGTLDDKREQVEALTLRYVLGELSETVYVVSLHQFIDVDEIRHLVMLNQVAHRGSTNYKRGMYR